MATSICKVQGGTVIGVDMGTKTGLAWSTVVDGQLGPTWATTINLLPDRLRNSLNKQTRDALRHHDPRPVYLWSAVQEVISQTPGPHLITFEDVKFSSTSYQSQLWGSLRGALWLTQASMFFGVHTAHLKIFATGRGSADKDLMDQFFLRQFEEGPRDDNLVDAMFAMCFGADFMGVDLKFGKGNLKQWTRVTTKVEEAISERLSQLVVNRSKRSPKSPPSSKSLTTSTRLLSRRTKTRSRKRKLRLS